MDWRHFRTTDGQKNAIDGAFIDKMMTISIALRKNGDIADTHRVTPSIVYKYRSTSQDRNDLVFSFVPMSLG